MMCLSNEQLTSSGVVPHGRWGRGGRGLKGEVQGLGLTKGCRGAWPCGAGLCRGEDLAASWGAGLGGGQPHRDKPALQLKGIVAQEIGVSLLSGTMVGPGTLRPAQLRAFGCQGGGPDGRDAGEEGAGGC